MCVSNFIRLQIEDSASRQAAEHLSKISRLQVRIQRCVRDFVFYCLLDTMRIILKNRLFWA